jgi:hypothetical protein
MFLNLFCQFQNSCDELDFLVEEFSKSSKVYAVHLHILHSPMFSFSFACLSAYFHASMLLSPSFFQLWRSLNWRRLGRLLLCSNQ